MYGYMYAFLYVYIYIYIYMAMSILYPSSTFIVGRGPRNGFGGKAKVGGGCCGRGEG